MNMKNLIILFAAAGLLLLVGCAKESGTADVDSITVEASIGTMTKVQYENDGTGTRFTAGDKIAVYGWIGNADEVPDTRVVNGVVNTLGTDGKWTPESQMLWKNVRDEHYFLGVFPARAITNFKADEYTLDPSKYTESDLLIARKLDGVKASDGPVKLAFDHAMAKLVVNLKFRSQWDATPTVSCVTALAKTKATVNYLTKAVTVTDDSPEAVDLAAESSAHTGYAYTYSGLQVPQDGVRKISVTIDNKEYVYESSTDIPLVAGQYTTLGLVVGKDKIELTGVTVSDWEAEAVLPDGEAKLADPGPGGITIDGSISDWDKVTDVFQTGKSRIVEWRVASDDTNVYFLYKVAKAEIPFSNGYEWAPYIYIGFDTDNDATTGSNGGAMLGNGLEAQADLYPWAGSTEGSPEILSGENTKGIGIECPVGTQTGCVTVDGMIDGNFCYIEVSVPLAKIGNPTGTITVNHSLSWETTGAQQITL